MNEIVRKVLMFICLLFLFLAIDVLILWLVYMMYLDGIVNTLLAFNINILLIWITLLVFPSLMPFTLEFRKGRKN